MPEQPSTLVPQVRRQLTLFAEPQAARDIETIRGTYNPEQHRLIGSHVTLCREDELTDLERVLHNLGTLKARALAIHFGKAIRFAEKNKGCQ